MNTWNNIKYMANLMNIEIIPELKEELYYTSDEVLGEIFEL